MYKMYTHFQYLYYSSTYAYLCRYVCPTLKAIDTSSLRLSGLKKRDPYSPCKIRDLFPAAIYPSNHIPYLRDICARVKQLRLISN